jgi:hypothetical protein
VQTYFSDFAEESTTSRTSSMKGEKFGTNGSDLDKNNIIKPTFDTLTEEDHKTFEAYRANLEELFLSDTTSIVFHKPEVIPEVRPDPSPSHNDIQSMINFVLQR